PGEAAGASFTVARGIACVGAPDSPEAPGRVIGVAGRGGVWLSGIVLLPTGPGGGTGAPGRGAAAGGGGGAPPADGRGGGVSEIVGAGAGGAARSGTVGGGTAGAGASDFS